MFKMRLIFFSLLSMTSFKICAETKPLPFWSYEGDEDPSVWGRLCPEYKMCSRGKNQSPIDIKAVDTKINLALPTLQFAYKKSHIKIINNGHTLQVNVENGSKLRIGEKEYELIQFHFHAPAEHIVNGSTAAIEIHFVHKDKQDHIVEVAVMLDIGKMNYILGKIFDNLPNVVNTTNTLEDEKMNPLDFFPQGGGYFTYEGSSTSPPCSENVTWIILHNNIEASLSQVMKLTSIYRMNARPTQPVNGRKIQRQL